jgi:hypothetical protein
LKILFRHSNKGGGWSWEDNVAHMRKIKNVHRILAGNMNAREHLEVLSIDGRIILKFFLNK